VGHSTIGRFKMTKLYYKDKPIIGLDISQTGIKVMAVDPKTWQVLGYGSIDLDPTKAQESLDGTGNYIAENITTLLTSKLVGELPSNHTIIGVPTGRSFSRMFNLPVTAEATLANAVEIEVEQYIPISVSALYVDYELIERTKEQLTIVVSAVPKSLIDSCVAAAETAGLVPIMVEPGINSVARVLESTEQGSLPTVIVDIGPVSTDIAVLDKGAIRVSGGLGVGGNTFTLDIAKKLGVAHENAHQLKVLSGLNAGPRQAKIVAALQPSLQRILTEIRKVIRYYNERLNDDRKLEQVLIVGAGSNIPGIGEYFTNELVMPVRVANPWQQLNFGNLPQPSKQFRSRYITVAGLASVNDKEIWK
jgi:type IV pilus assembly protein PilM